MTIQVLTPRLDDDIDVDYDWKESEDNDPSTTKPTTFCLPSVSQEE